MLSQPDHHKHLGVILTQNLCFDTHIGSLTARFRSRVVLLCHMSHFLPFNVVHLLYKCYVRPAIGYAIPAWISGLKIEHINTLDKLQARVARSCLSLRSGSSIDWLTPKEELNRLCNWSSLQFRRHILCLCFFHHLYYYFPDLLTDFGFHKSHSFRHPSSLILPKVGSHFGNSYLFRFSIAWNNLQSIQK